jgi:hypothetical protein
MVPSVNLYMGIDQLKHLNQLPPTGNSHRPNLSKPLPSIINEEEEEGEEQQPPFKPESLVMNIKRQESFHRRSISQGLGNIFNKLGLYSKAGKKTPQGKLYSYLNSEIVSCGHMSLLVQVRGASYFNCMVNIVEDARAGLVVAI